MAKSPSGPLATERKGISQRSSFLRRGENFCNGLLRIQGSDWPPEGLGRCLWSCCAVAMGPQLAGCLQPVGTGRGSWRRPDWDIKTGCPRIGIWRTCNCGKTGPPWSYLGEASLSVSLFLLFIENLLCAQYCTQCLQTLSFYATTILQNEVAKLSHFTNREAEALVAEVSWCSLSRLFVRVSAPGLTPKAEASARPPRP